MKCNVKNNEGVCIFSVLPFNRVWYFFLYDYLILIMLIIFLVGLLYLIDKSNFIKCSFFQCINF